MMKHSHKLSLAAAGAALAVMTSSHGAVAQIELSMCRVDGTVKVGIMSDDPLLKYKISMGGDALFKDKAKNEAKEVGSTEIHRTIEDGDSVPNGTYKVDAKTIGGTELSDSTTLDDCEPDPPVVESIDGCAVSDLGDNADGDCFTPDFLPGGDGDFDVEFEDVNACASIDHYDFHLQCEDFDDAFVTKVDPADCSGGTCTVTVANSSDNVSDNDATCTITVTAVDDTCNTTSSSITYDTDDSGADGP